MSSTQCDVQAIVKTWLKELRQGGDVEMDKYFGKRTEPRWFVWGESLEVFVDDETVLARGENLSTTGLGFVCKRLLPRGEIVQVRRVDDDYWVPVRVQHSTQTIGSYKVGARFVM